MRILYAARVCQFNLLRPVCMLAQRIATWDAVCDRRLNQLVPCIQSSLDRRLVGYVGDDVSGLLPHLFADTVLADCDHSQRGIIGVTHCARGSDEFPYRRCQ